MRTHLQGKDDALVQVEPMPAQVGNWAGCLALDVDDAEAAVMRRHERTGRPLGDAGFIAGLESQLGPFPTKRKPGPKRKKNANSLWCPHN